MSTLDYNSCSLIQNGDVVNHKIMPKSMNCLCDSMEISCKKTRTEGITVNPRPITERMIKRIFIFVNIKI